MTTKNFVVKNGLTTGNINLYAGNSNIAANYVVANLVAPASANLGAVANVKITGGTSGYVLATNGSGTLSWVPQSGTPAGSTNEIQYNGGGSFASSSGFTFDPTYNIGGGLLSVGYTGGGAIQSDDITAGTSISSLGTAHITGNLTSGNASLGNLVSANYYVGDGGLLSNITVAAGSSITNGNSNVQVTANSNVRVSVNGVSNTAVFTSTGVNIAGYATITGTVTAGNFSGNGSLLTNLTGANVTGTVANATYALTTGSATTAATVTTNAQPNITSVGTLSSLTVAGDTTLTGNLTVSGTFEYANVSSFKVKDPIIEQGGNTTGTALTSNDGFDRGQILHYYSGAAAVDAFIGWDNSNAEFALGSNVTVASEVVTFNSFGNLRLGNIIGNGQTLTGNLIANNASFGTGAATGLYGQPLIVRSNTANAMSTFGIMNENPNAYSISVFYNNAAAETGAVGFAGVSAPYFANSMYLYSATGTNGLVLSGNIGAAPGNKNLWITNAGLVTIPGSTAATNTTSGAFQVTGGVGVGGNLYAGNLSGTNITGTITTAVQPNITSVGTLASLSVTANVTAGNLIGVYANGNSNISIPAANGNILFSSTGTANVLVVSGTGANVAGTLNATGTVSGATGIIGGAITGQTFGLVARTTDGTTGTIGVQAQSATNYSSISFLNNANLLLGAVGTGGSSATYYPNQVYMWSNNGIALSGNGYSDTGGTKNLYITNAGLVTIPGSTVATNTTSGAFQVTGGVGVGGNLYAGNLSGTNISGTLTTAAQPNITSVGTLTALTSGLITATSGGVKVGNIQDPSGTNTISLASGSVSMLGSLNVGTGGTGNVTATYFIGSGNLLSNIAGGNVNGQVANALIATTITASAQPNITSVGTLSGLTGTGVFNLTGASNVSLGSNSTVKITGGLASQYLQTDGAGNLTWATVSGGSGSGSSISNGTSNVNISTSNGNVQIVTNGNSIANITGTGVNVAGTLGVTGLITATAGGIKVGNLQDTSGTNTITLSSGSVSILGGLTVGTGGTGNITAVNANLGNLVTANYFTGVLTTNAQPNITSIGTLNSLTTNGTIDFTGASNISLGPNANVHISGGTTGQVLSTNGSGALSWITPSGGSGGGTSIANGTSNVNIASSDGNVTVSVAGAANVLTVTSTGINVTGNSNLGSNTNVLISGGISGQVLATNGDGTLFWTTAGSSTVYQLDDITNYTDGQLNTFMLAYNQNLVAITDPFGILVTINGAVQPAFVWNTDVVWQNFVLSSQKGYTIINPGYLTFTDPPPAGAEIMVRTVTGITNTVQRRYPFMAGDIMLG